MIHTLDTIMSEYYQHVDVYKKMQHDVEDIKALFMYKGSGYCSESTSKMLRISSVWRIRQIKFQKQS